MQSGQLSTTKLGKTFAERAAAVEPFMGKECVIAYGQFDKRTITAVVVGASWHKTNGNSTGDLIVSAGPGQVFVGSIHGEETRFKCYSIALARVQSIEAV